MNTTTLRDAASAALTDITPAPPLEAPESGQRVPVWAHVTSAAAIALVAGAAIGYAYAGARIEPETIVIDANAACVDGMTAAERALIARDRADELDEPIITTSVDLYGAILAGSDLDVDQARRDLDGLRMLNSQQESRAAGAWSELRAAAVLCPPAPEQ